MADANLRPLTISGIFGRKRRAFGPEAKAAVRALRTALAAIPYNPRRANSILNELIKTIEREG